MKKRDHLPMDEKDLKFNREIAIFFLSIENGKESVECNGVAAITHLRTCVILNVQIQGKSSIFEALNSHTI